MPLTSAPSAHKPPRLPDLPPLPGFHRNLGQRPFGPPPGSSSPRGPPTPSGATASSGSARSWKEVEQWKDAPKEGQSPYSRPVPIRVGEMSEKRRKTGDSSQRSWSSGQAESGWNSDSGSCTRKQSPSTTPKASVAHDTSFRIPGLPQARQGLPQGLPPPGLPALSVDIGSDATAFGIPPPPPPIDFELIQGLEGTGLPHLDLPSVDGRSFHLPIGFPPLPGALPGSPLVRDLGLTAVGGASSQVHSSRSWNGAPGQTVTPRQGPSNAAAMQGTSASWTKQVDGVWDDWAEHAA